MVQARSPECGPDDSTDRPRRLVPRLVVPQLLSEVEMQMTMFERPLYLRERKDLILEITNLDDAIDFLEEWSKGDHDIIHDATLKTCYLAHDGHKPVQVARDALRAFAKKKGILVKAPAVAPWMIKAKSGGGRLSP